MLGMSKLDDQKRCTALGKVRPKADQESPSNVLGEKGSISRGQQITAWYCDLPFPR